METGWPVVAIIQARMGSTRLPGKVLAQVGGKPVLAHVIQRLQGVESIDEVVVATTTESKDDVIVDLCGTMGVGVFRGSEEDLLGRFYHAAGWIGAKTIVRICGEDIFIDPKVVGQLVDLHLERRPDYTTNVIGRTFPEGLYAEILSATALEVTHRQAVLPEHREHVTLYILDNPEQFYIEEIKAAGKLRRPDIKLSVDTQGDLDFVRMLYDELGGEQKLVDTDDILDFLSAKEPEQSVIPGGPLLVKGSPRKGAGRPA